MSDQHNQFVIARYRAGLTMQEAAEKAGVSIGTIHALESGKTRRPSVPTAAALARVYNLDDPSVLLRDAA